MKVKVEIVKGLEEPEITIKCNEQNEEIDDIVRYLESIKVTLIGKKDGESYILDLQDVYYFETVEKRTFAYVEKDVYEVGYRLYELAEMYKQTSFVQASRTIVVNINCIKKITTLVNGRILALLYNGEKLIISRVYAQNFKQQLIR